MCLLWLDLGKVWLLSWLHCFLPFWRGLQCHRLGDCSTDCSKIRSQNAIPIALEMIAKTARGYFEIWRETRVLASYENSWNPLVLLHHCITAPQSNCQSIRKKITCYKQSPFNSLQWVFLLAGIKIWGAHFRFIDLKSLFVTTLTQST